MASGEKSRIGRDPFEPPAEKKDALRRLRGRLALPVSIWTAYDGSGMGLGLTVSSFVVAEGEPGMVVGLIGPLTELSEAVQESRRFAVHVLGSEDAGLAKRFAGAYPIEDPFEGTGAEPSSFGPLLSEVPDRLLCKLHSRSELGWSLMMVGEVAEVNNIPHARGPLVHYRGSYLRP